MRGGLDADVGNRRGESEVDIYYGMCWVWVEYSQCLVFAWYVIMVLGG